MIGRTERILDLPHNTFEAVAEGVIIRKGSVKLSPGELAILPSHMSGDAVLIKATPQMTELL